MRLTALETLKLRFVQGEIDLPTFELQMATLLERGLEDSRASIALDFLPKVKRHPISPDEARSNYLRRNGGQAWSSVV